MKFRFRSANRRNEELQEEIQAHLTLAEREELESGRTRKDAQSAARREFGNVSIAEETTRDMWGTRWLTDFLQDLRYAFRTLRQNLLFTTVAVLTLALGIGANTAIFTVVNAVLFHPLAVREPGGLVVLHDQFPSWNMPRTKISPLQFVELSHRTDLFESSGAFKPVNLNLAERDKTTRLQVMEATSGLFTALGVEPSLGRTFTTMDEARGSAHVVLLSHSLWHRLFAGNPRAVGEMLQLDGSSYQIIGILPRSLETLYPRVEAWTPAIFSTESLTEEHRWYVDYTMVARLRKDVTVAQARVAVKAITQRFNADGLNFGIEVRPLLEEQVGDVRGSLYILWGAVGLVLLVACSNIANLLLAQSISRSREIAVRVAMGASRVRLVRQLLTENLLLSFIGATLAVLLAYAFLTGLVRMAPLDLPHLDMIRLDSHVLVFTLVISVIAAIFFGLAPSAFSVRIDVVKTLKESGRGQGTSRTARTFRAVLVTCEIALALVLLVGSGLLLRTFAKILDVKPGFDTANLLTMRVSLPSATSSDPKQGFQFSNTLLDRISSIPGVIHASIATGIPFAPDGYNTTFEIRNSQEQPNQPTPHANVTYVSTGYFKTLRIPLIQGRFFIPAELRYGNWLGKGAVIMIDETLAKHYWPTRNPIGAEIGNDGQWATIVGVVGSVHDQDLATPSDGTIYIPGYGGTALAVRTATEGTPLSGVISDQVRAINRDVSVYDVAPMRSLIATSLARRRFATTLVTLFALLAFVLALTGLYGVIAYLVTERAPEIGLRLALGAQRKNVFRLMLTEGLRMALVGIALGLLSYALIHRFIASQLFGIGPLDLFTLTAVSFSLLGMAASAILIPARRAMQVDPMIALRYE